MPIFGKRKDFDEGQPVSPGGSDKSPRAACLHRLGEVLDGAGRKQKGSVLMLYLENFKTLNDTFGYEYSELLLHQITEYCAQLTQSEVLRNIGVQLVMILEGYSFGQTQDLMDQLSERFFSAWSVRDVDCICNICGGVAFYPGHAQTAQELLKNLEVAVDESAIAGINHFTIYDDTLAAKRLRKQNIAYAIQEALEQDNFEIRYRATYHVPERKFARAEVALRLPVPEIGIVNSNEFISIAEDSGQICALDYYAIEKVCVCIQELMHAGKEFESIAVPISPVMFFQENFPEAVDALLKKYGVPPKKLGLEFTESMLITAFPSVNVMMQELADLGVELILNDFGSGYSGINNILSLPVSVLKLQRLFIWQLETNPRSGYLIQGLIQIAHNLGLKLIAEGVETENQLKLLAEYGCVYEQGFYYAPTVVRDTLMKMLPDKAAN